MSRLAQDLNQPPFQRVPRFLAPWLKRQLCEAAHCPPPCPEVKNELSYTPIPPIYLHGVDKHNFDFFSFRFSYLRLVVLEKYNLSIPQFTHF
jgi:hypothetical protein